MTGRGRIGLERGRIELAHGPLSYASVGDGPVVVLLHQTPRSCDEYRDVLPLLRASGYRAIAFDTPGFGRSAPLPGEPTIERWADVVSRGLDVLSVDRAAVVGHHTGGVVAVELAAQRPERTTALVLSSTPLTDIAYRAAPPDESGVDAGEDAQMLRRSRAGFYPADRPELLDRYVEDALLAGPLAQKGHHVVGAYQMDDRVKRLTMPVLLIGADRDPYAFPQLERLRGALPGASVAVIEGGMVPLPDGWPEQFAGAVSSFLGRISAGCRTNLDGRPDGR
jgi:pimeloyl-ACP methyl ester carboxylesterase